MVLAASPRRKMCEHMGLVPVVWVENVWLLWPYGEQRFSQSVEPEGTAVKELPEGNASKELPQNHTGKPYQISNCRSTRASDQQARAETSAPSKGPVHGLHSRLINANGCSPEDGVKLVPRGEYHHRMDYMQDMICNESTTSTTMLDDRSEVGETLSNLDSQCSFGSIAEDMLADILGAVALQPWNKVRRAFIFVKRLQDAKRNNGCVELMRYLETGGFVAVKRMPIEWVTTSAANFQERHPQSSENPWRDMGLVRYLHSRGCPYICEPVGSFQDATDAFVVSEFAVEGDLFSWCQKFFAPPGRKREREIRPFVVQLLDAVQWLHRCGIAHRDLSLENVVLTRISDQSGIKVKLIDFGMSTVARISDEICGKPSYQAPEMHDGGGYDTFLADAFALGVIVYCIAVGDYPWHSTSPDADAMFRYVKSNGLLQFFGARKLRTTKGKKLTEVCSYEFVEFVKHLLEPEASERHCVASDCFDPTGRCRLPCIRGDVWLS